MGFVGYMFASIKKEELRKSLSMPEQYEILLVIALGKPKEKIDLRILNILVIIKTHIMFPGALLMRL